jgi:hypothetical protein
MPTPKVKEIRYDELLGPLIDEMQPVRRVWPVSVRFALWLIVELGLLATVALAFPRDDLGARLHDIRYILELGFFSSAGIIAALLALRTAIPGREASRVELLALGSLAIAAVVLVTRGQVRTDLTLNAFVDEGVRCLLCTTVLAALPWALLFWAVRRGAPLPVETAGGLIGAAAFCFAFAATRLGCPDDGVLHVLVWHVLPVALGACLSIFAGTAWLRKRSRADSLALKPRAANPR